MSDVNGKSEGKRTPEERLRWWEKFNTIVYEVGEGVIIAEQILVDHIPAEKRQAFADAMKTLYDVLQKLDNDHIRQVIRDLKDGKEPDVPDIDLPPLPSWPDDHDSESIFKEIWHLLLPFLLILVEKIGKESDIGLAFLEVISAANDVLDQLQTAGVAGFENF
jgi:hypothetical protein